MEIYLSLGVTQDVETQSVPRIDDGVSAPIFTEFPLGLLQETTIYVCVGSMAICSQLGDI